MNKQEAKAMKAARHEVYMFKAAWLAFCAQQSMRLKTAAAKDMLQGIDGAIHAAIDAINHEKIVSIRVEVWEQVEMFSEAESAALEALESLLDRQWPNADDDPRTVKEELRRRGIDDKDIPF